MATKMLNTGFGTYIAVHRVKAMMKYETAKIKKDIARLKESDVPGSLLDCTRHNTAKTVIILDDNTHVLCAIGIETMLKRIEERRDGERDE